MNIITTDLVDTVSYPEISISSLIKRFKIKICITWLLVLLEGAAYLTTPLVIGIAINDLLAGSSFGIILLSGLCLSMLLIGSLRRFYDTRAYGKIYRTVSTELVEKERKRQSSISTISARSQLFTEFIEFLEYSIPKVSHNLINLIGTLVIIAIMNQKIFLLCLCSALLTTLIYWFSGDKILHLNRGENDELEKQVTYLQQGNTVKVHDHFNRLMKWKIRLSDLETLNFLGVWLGLSAALICSVLLLAGGGGAAVGTVVTVVMYVFGFMESSVAFPLYYQQLVRLQEIAGRLQ